MAKPSWALTGVLAGWTLAAGCDGKDEQSYCTHPDKVDSAECSLSLHCESATGIDLRTPTFGLVVADSPADNLWFTPQSADVFKADTVLPQSSGQASKLAIPQTGHLQITLDAADPSSVLASRPWPRGGALTTNLHIGQDSKTIATGLCMASVSPQIAATMPARVDYPAILSISSTSYTMKAPLRIQIGAPDATRALFVTEFYSGLMDFNYLERYQWSDATKSPARQSPAWYDQTQGQIDELQKYGPLFAMARNTLLLYLTATTKDLTTVTLNSRTLDQNWRNGQKSPIPADAVQLSAATDADWFVLSGAEYVQAFRTPPNLQRLGSSLAIAPALLAARAPLAGVPAGVESPRYDVVAVSKANQVWLLRVGDELTEPSPDASQAATLRLRDSMQTTQVMSVALADLNEDGMQDLVVLPSGGGQLLWSAQRVANTFAPFTPLLTSIPSGASSVAVGDLLGDGAPELAVSVVPTDGAQPFVQVYSLQR